MDEIQIISLSPSEWQLYKALRLKALQSEPQAFLTTYEEAIKTSDTEWMSRLEKTIINDAEGYCFAKVNARLVGMVGAFGSRAEAEIIAMFVDKVYRGKGMGFMLLDTTVRQLREAGVVKLKLEVNAIMAPAIGLYKKCGFEVVGEQKRVLGDGKEYPTLLMAKRSD